MGTGSSYAGLDFVLNEPGLIGQAISHGCVRMKNGAVQEVSRLVPAGSPVIIEK